MTFPTTRRIFACLFSNHSNDKYLFSNYPKIGVGVTKEKYEFHTSFSTSKKATQASAYFENYLVPTPTKNMQLRLPTLTSQPWRKANNLCKVSCLVSVSNSKVSSRLVSVLKHHVSIPPLIVFAV